MWFLAFGRHAGEGATVSGTAKRYPHWMNHVPNSIVPITAGVMLALAGSAAAGSNCPVRRQRQRGVELLHSTTPVAFGAYDARGNRFTQRCRPLQQERRVPDRPRRRRRLALTSTAAACRSIGETLQYNLYIDSLVTAPIWGNNAGGTGWVTGTGGGLGLANQVTHTVYGRLPNNAVNQGAGVGAYSDLITATITY
jgi:hypothetical protein